MLNVEIYSKEECIWCEKTKNILENLNIKYKDYILNKHYTKEELQEKIPEVKTLPQIYVNNKHIGGYSEFTTYIEEVISNYAHDI